MVFTIITASNAQLSLGGEADQKSIEVKISSSGEVNVKHVVKPSNIPVNVDLLDGTISDISITNDGNISVTNSSFVKVELSGAPFTTTT
mgnify:CR=1 FL=1